MRAPGLREAERGRRGEKNGGASDINSLFLIVQLGQEWRGEIGGMRLGLGWGGVVGGGTLPSEWAV